MVGEAKDEGDEVDEVELEVMKLMKLMQRWSDEVDWSLTAKNSYIQYNTGSVPEMRAYIRFRVSFALC